MRTLDVSQQRRRSVLSAQALNALHYLHLQWLQAGQPWDSDDQLITPQLLRRIRRVSGEGNLGPKDLKRLLDVEIRLSLEKNLLSLEWLTHELQLCLCSFPCGVLPYLQQQRELMSAERRGALCCIAISRSSDPAIRQALLTYLADTIGIRIALPVSRATKCEGFVTRAQEQVLNRLIEIGDAFFNREPDQMSARLSPLLAGPSGSGKTFLARLAAKRFNAHVIATTPGDWVPQGANDDFEPTTYAVLAALAEHRRVVLIIDEIDKFRPNWDSTWSRSVAADLWKVLDGVLPVRSFAQSSRSNLTRVGISEVEVAARIPHNLWIVGCGTWQSHWNPNISIGFGRQTAPEALDTATMLSTKTIPAELALRFHPQVLAVTYPTPSETQEIYTKSGLADAAAELGICLDPLTHDWSQGGIRSLEAIWAEVAIRRRKLSSSTQHSVGSIP